MSSHPEEVADSKVHTLENVRTAEQQARGPQRSQHEEGNEAGTAFSFIAG